MAQVEIEIVGKDSMSGVLGNVGSIITGIESAINLAGQAFQAITGFVGGFVEEAMGAENAMADLEAVVLSTGGAAGYSAQELMTMAGGFQEVTRFADDVIAKGEGMLATFTNIGHDVFPLATEAMLDMATKMGTDPVNAAIQLGKALNDPIAGITALTRVGVAFTDQQKEQIKVMVEAGDIEGAQKLILAELSKEFGGAAEAAGQTFAGQLDIAKNKISDVKEAIGGMLLPILKDLLTRFIEFTDSNPFLLFLGRISELMSGGANPIHAAAVALMEMSDGAGALGPLMHDLGVAMERFDVMILQGVDPLKAFQTALGILANSDGPLAGIAVMIQDVIKAFDSGGILAAVDTFVGDIVQGLADSISNWVTAGGPQELARNFLSWLDALGTGPDAQSKILTAIGSLITSLINAVTSIPPEQWGRMVSAMDAALARAIDNPAFWTSSGDAFGNAIANAFKVGSDPNTNKWQWVENIPFVIAYRMIQKLLSSETLQAVGGALSDLWLGAAGVADWQAGADLIAAGIHKYILDPITNLLGGWNLQLNNKLIDMSGINFQQIADDMFAGFSEVGRNMADGIKAGWTDFTGWVQEQVDKFVSDWKRHLGIASPSTVFFEIGRNIVQGLIDGVSGMWSTFSTFITTKISNLLSNLSWENILAILKGDMSLSDLLGGGGSTAPMIGYDKGATEDWPTTGGTTSTSTMTGGGGVINNFYGAVYFGDMGQLGYDCPSPHPLMTASSQSLLTSNIG